MARPLRVEFEGALYHVTSRGNAKQRIYVDDDDRILFLKVLAEVVERFGWICHAYCLMSNHYHLLIETPRANLSRGMRHLNGVYTQMFNRKYKRSGHIFQGRFMSRFIEKETHLLEVARYIVLNPVRAKMVGHPREWKWSSFCAISGQIATPVFLSIDWLLSQFHAQRERAIAGYCRFVEDGVDIRLWENLVGGILLGSDSFCERLKPLLADVTSSKEIPRIERALAQPALRDLFKDVGNSKSTRNARIYEAIRQHGYTLKQVGDHVGLHYASVSRIVKLLDGH
ncbi:transposase [Candidatus Bipolaricaulota bacterium]|nr:transposase [Candidatus Bipolaricaulota bacterium]